MATDRALSSFKAWVNTFVIEEDSTVLLVTNSHRVRYVICNTEPIYVKLGYGCSPIDYSYKLYRNSHLEDFFQGPITACVGSGSSICTVTEEV